MSTINLMIMSTKNPVFAPNLFYMAKGDHFDVCAFADNFGVDAAQISGEDIQEVNDRLAGLADFEWLVLWLAF